MTKIIKNKLKQLLNQLPYVKSLSAQNRVLRRQNSFLRESRFAAGTVKIQLKENLLCLDKASIDKLPTLKQVGIDRKTKSSELIVSLTSFPQRQADLPYCLHSLMTQTLKPNRVILWLGKKQYPEREKSISPTILKFKHLGLEIKFVQDLKSYTKLIFALREFPHAIIVTADDDVYYPSNWLENLFVSYQKYPKCVHAHRAHRVRLNRQQIFPYDTWEKSIAGESISPLNFFTGVGGVLYPPQILGSKVDQKKIFLKLCPSNDDIWYWAMAVLADRQICVVEHNFRDLIYLSPERELGQTGERTLVSLNVHQKRNDVQLGSVLSYFPELWQKLAVKL